MTDETIVLDQPAQISAWYFMSAISQLTLELKTGRNFYGRGSVLAAIKQRGWTSVTGNATRRNKVLALSELLDTANLNGLGGGPVATAGEAELERQCADLGVVIERQTSPVAG